jgi:DNA-binding XRE family transcriptional regulator
MNIELLEDYRWKHRMNNKEMAEFLGINYGAYKALIKKGGFEKEKVLHKIASKLKIDMNILLK